MKLNLADGYYISSYFFMYIDSEEEINTAIEENNQIFAHEFIHYLQDLFLPYNLRANLISIRDFSLVATSAHEPGFKRPFKDWDSDSQLTYKQQTYTWGDDICVDEVEGISEMESKYFDVPETNAKIFMHNAILSDGTFYQIGARDILEYIAHKIESRHWPADNTPDLPYRTLDKLFEYKGLSDAPDIVRIAIAEFSLHNDNPANHLLFTVDWIIANFGKGIFESYEKMKGLLLSSSWDSTGGFHETMLSKTNRRLDEIKTLLQDRFDRGNYSDIGRWIDSINTFARKNMQGRLYFSEMYDLNFDEFSELLTKIMLEIGVPLVFNSKHECYSFLPDTYDHNQFIHLFVAHEFMKFATTTDPKCRLYEYCSTNNSELIDGNCLTNPIARGVGEQLCQFGQIVKLYDMHKIT